MYGVVCVQVDVLVDEVMSGGDPALVCIMLADTWASLGLCGWVNIQHLAFG
jgi:hypothetical protein